MNLIMNCWDEEITDADHPALCRLRIFSGNNSFSFEKIWGTWKKFKTNYPWVINEIPFAVFPLPKISSLL